MHWAREYYTYQSATFATATITEQHKAIARQLHEHCTQIESCSRVLELGAGNGGVACSLAMLGYDVTAIEFNPRCAQLARDIASTLQPGHGSLTIIEDDFYTVQLKGQFDFIYYWDGFGIGADVDQQRLLKRIASEWLQPRGRALIDVFSPWNWMRRHGETSTYTALDGTPWQRRVEFDAASNRFIDTWQPIDMASDDVGHEPRSQAIRCYSIPDFELLLNGTGLHAVSYIGMDGSTLAATHPSLEFDRDMSAHLLETNGYLALLKHGG